MNATAPLLVVQTYYCPRPPHFEVQLAATDDPEALRLVFRTDNPDAYFDALDAEGTAQRFIAHWHADRAVRILESLTLAEHAHV